MTKEHTTPPAPGFPAGDQSKAHRIDPLNPAAPPVSPEPLGTNSVAGNNVGGRGVEAPVPEEVRENMEHAAERAGVDETTGQPVDTKKAKK